MRQSIMYVCEFCEREYSHADSAYACEEEEKRQAKENPPPFRVGDEALDSGGIHVKVKVVRWDRDKPGWFVGAEPLVRCSYGYVETYYAEFWTKLDTGSRVE